MGKSVQTDFCEEDFFVQTDIQHLDAGGYPHLDWDPTIIS